VAQGAALGLDGRMLVDERTGSLDVALGADSILGRANAELVRLEGPMRIMAVTAAHQAFVYLVMKWLRKGRFHVCVAGIAKLWLRYLEKTLLSRKLMHAVAAGATYLCFAVGGTLEIWMSVCMTTKTFIVNQSCLRLAEPEDLRCIPATFDVSLARSVTAFARHAFTAMFECQPGVGIIVETLDLGLMTGRTGFRPSILRGINCRFWR
jgi:hypothetical protein